MNQFFHIASRPVGSEKPTKWEVGTVLRTGEFHFNSYFQSVLNYHHVLPVGKTPFPVLAALRFGFVAAFTGQDVATQCAEIIETHFKVIREFEFEAIRRAEFPGLPSRMRCVWMSEVIQVEHWSTRLDGRENPILLRVAAEGKIHRAHEGHLSVEVQSIDDLRDSARAYWSGKPHESGNYEVLLEGEMKVLEILPFPTASSVGNAS